MDASTTAFWPQRVDSLASGATPSSASTSIRSLSTRWKPSWLSKKLATTDSNGSSRRQSSCTIRSSFSASTASSASTQSSGFCSTYQLRSPSSYLSSTNKDTAESYPSTVDATLALALLVDDDLGIDEDRLRRSRHNGTRPDTSASRGNESRAMSTISRASSNPRDLPAASAEVEMGAMKYYGYHRPSFIGALPATAAICGTMLLNARFPGYLANAKITSTCPELRDQASALRGGLDESASPEQAMQGLHKYGLEAVIIALRSSLDAANISAVPERPAWSIYEKIAQAKNHPDKLPNLWKDVSKLLKKIPPEQMVTIMFLLSVARTLQSRDIEIDGKSPAVYLLRKLWPRYVSEDATKLLMLHYDQLPLDLPLVLEAVNYRFGGRRCNLLALGAGSEDPPASIEHGPRGVQEMCAA